MFNKRNIIFLSILIVILFSLCSVVSAEDNTNLNNNFTLEDSSSIKLTQISDNDINTEVNDEDVVYIKNEENLNIDNSDLNESSTNNSNVKEEVKEPLIINVTFKPSKPVLYYNVGKKVTINQVLAAANTFRLYVNSKKKLPNTTNVGKYKCSIPQLLYLMTVSIKYINAKKKISSKISIRAVTVSKPTGVYINKRVTSYLFKIC